MKIRRRSLLSDDARAALPLEPGEKAIAAALGDAGWVVATGRALVTSSGRMPWTEVAHAQWYDEEQVLAVDPVAGEGQRLLIRLAEPGRLPETVHERVMASIVLSRRVAVPGGGGVRLVARRGQGRDPVRWQVVPDDGTDLAAPGVQEFVDDALARLRGELGA
ncbi:MAG: hypothetical protein ABI807_10575 [Sporichthyaceae bacterium]